MKARVLTISLLAGALVLTGCMQQDDPNRRAKTGAAIGAVVGAVVGHQVDELHLHPSRWAFPPRSRDDSACSGRRRDGWPKTDQPAGAQSCLTWERTARRRSAIIAA